MDQALLAGSNRSCGLIATWFDGHISQLMAGRTTLAFALMHALGHAVS